MTIHEIYLDNNATTMPLKEVADAMAQALVESYGNPSSPHNRGAIARQILQEARQHVANLVGCHENGIIFTSGGTEANNLVLHSLCKPVQGSRLITSATEHSSVLKTAQWLQEQGVEVQFLDVDDSGFVDLTSLQIALEQPASLVSIQWANSETGTIQPIVEIGKLCKTHSIPFHVDCAAAVGRIHIDLAQLPISYLTFTAHKIHGPQGIGAVATLDNSQLQPMLQGGDQEGGIRPGTENIVGIVGFGKAAKLRHDSLPDTISKLRHLRNTFEARVLGYVPQGLVNGCSEDNKRIVNTTNIQFPDVDGMAMVAQLDNLGVCCSLTSACVSSRPEPSHVLLAMGLTEEKAYSSIRFSFSILNTEDDAKEAADKANETYWRLHDLSIPSGMIA